MPGDIVWEREHEDSPENTTKVWIGKVCIMALKFPFGLISIMLCSTFCILRDLQEQDLYNLNE